jgi:TolB-like protein/tetratricopeptide (TPR) repeat protein
LSFFNELKRRNVIRVGVAYIVTAWVIIQVVETLFPVFEIGNESIRLVVILLAVGLLPVLFFAWAFELTSEGVKREKNVDRSQSITPQTGKKLDRWVIAMLVLALTYFVLDKFILDPGRDAELIKATAQQTEQAVLNRTPEKSIAVLPFVNMSSDPEQEFFSDGISEEILNSLAQVSDLKVAGRTSSFSFKGRNNDLRQIGELLNVAHVLEGSVRKSGNRVRITAQLIKTDDGYHLWSETFDRELTDVFAIQDEIAGAILDQLKMQLLGEPSRVVPSYRTDTEVYELYLQARNLVRERTQKSIELAAQLLERSIALDPHYAPAYAQLGISTLLMKLRAYSEIPHDEALTQGRKQLEIALELNPDLAEAWAGLGLYESANDNAAKAIEILERALSINPNLPDTLHWLQLAKARVGDVQGSYAIAERVLEIDPLYLPGISSVIHNYIEVGQVEKGLSLLGKLPAFLADAPSILHVKSELYFTSGQYALGIPIAEAGIRQTPNDREVRELLCFAWNATHQFERTIGLCSGRAAAIAYWQLGQFEEALVQAHDPDDAGRYEETFFQVLNASGNSERLIEFLESRWSDINDFASGYWFDADMMGYASLNEIALAYIRAGNHERVQDALTLVLEGHENLLANGRNNIQFAMNQAVYFALTGDYDTAQEHLSMSIDGGYIGSTRLTRLWPAFEPLEADSRYQAIQKRMITHLNEERKALGLEPIAE